MSRFASGARALMVVLMGLAGLAVATSCGSTFGGVLIGVGSTPNIPPQTFFNMLGTPGTPFSATVTDATSSWQVTGVVPMVVVLLNNSTPIWMVATKLTSAPNLLSMQLINGGTVVALASTTAPYGTVQTQTGTLGSFAPPANPDVRFFMRGAAGEQINGIIEDTTTGFLVGETAPVLYLFESPNGKVDAQLNQVTNTGPMVVDLQFGHPPGPPPVVISKTSIGPSITVVQP